VGRYSGVDCPGLLASLLRPRAVRWPPSEWLRTVEAYRRAPPGRLRRRVGSAFGAVLGRVPELLTARGWVSRVRPLRRRYHPRCGRATLSW